MLLQYCLQCKVKQVRKSNSRCSECSETGRLVCINCNTRNASRRGALCEHCYVASGADRAKCNRCQVNLVRSNGLCKSCQGEMECGSNRESEKLIKHSNQSMMCSKCSSNRSRAGCGGLCQSCYNADMREQTGQARRIVRIPVRSQRVPSVKRNVKG